MTAAIDLFIFERQEHSAWSKDAKKRPQKLANNKQPENTHPPHPNK